MTASRRRAEVFAHLYRARAAAGAWQCLLCDLDVQHVDLADHLLDEHDIAYLDLQRRRWGH